MRFSGLFESAGAASHTMHIVPVIHRRLTRPFRLLLVGCFYTVALATYFASPAGAQSETQYILDLTDYDSGSVHDWLTGKGFRFKADADNRRKVDLNIGPDGLIIEIRKKARALLANERIDIPNVGRIRISWKVDRYPSGASYEAGVRNEAIMAMVFFGSEKISSGSLLIPDSPFFIGLFLCKDGQKGTPHIGRYYQKGGRYVCLDQPAEGELTVSEYDLASAFAEFFDAGAVPAITGIVIQADTTGLPEDGKSQATLRSIEFLKPE